MKKLQFKKLSIISNREKTALTETISPSETVITGLNGVGKSAFIKHLYASIAADPKSYGDISNAGVQTLNYLSIDDVDFVCYRNGSNIAFFDGNKTLLAQYTTVAGSGKFLCEKLHMQIKLPGAKASSLTPWPASIFAPFYIDQDDGWKQPANSFNLSAFSSAERNVMEFHTGLKPKEFYIAEAQLKSINEKKGVLSKERGHLEYAQELLKSQAIEVGIRLNAEDFEKEIQLLLKELNTINEKLNAKKRQLSDFQSQKVILHDEFLLAEATLKELEKDSKHLKTIEQTEIPCPTCGVMHENNFSNTFSLMDDITICREYKNQSFNDLNGINQKIEKTLKEISTFEASQVRINELLSVTKGKITLQQAIEQESRKQSNRVFINKFDEIDREVGNLDAKISQYKKEKNKFTAKKRKDDILNFYVSKLEVFCKELNTQPTDKMRTDIKPNIDATGSDSSRKLLAYNYAILHTINKYSSALFAPIVIDTPNQQEQDDNNINAIIPFAFNNRPENYQFILGAVDLHDYEYNGKIIKPENKDQLLQSDQFDAVTAEFEPFLKNYYEALKDM